MEQMMRYIGNINVKESSMLTVSGFRSGFHVVTGTKDLVTLNFNTVKARILRF